MGVDEKIKPSQIICIRYEYMSTKKSSEIAAQKKWIWTSNERDSINSRRKILDISDHLLDQIWHKVIIMRGPPTNRDSCVAVRKNTGFSFEESQVPGDKLSKYSLD